ncbi:MAG: hypothetical protein HYS12_26490 [Planctomycetes bacterium]|nr:hypothetical protein [Planctomycetota bacterium]
MNATHLTTTGTIKPDGTLELDGKTNLPPGRVRVTLNIVPEQPGGREDVLTVLQRIHAARNARGMKPRSAEEIDAYINALRDELEEHANQIEAIQEEARRARERGGC